MWVRGVALGADGEAVEGGDVALRETGERCERFSTEVEDDRMIYRRVSWSSWKGKNGRNILDRPTRMLVALRITLLVE